MREAVGAVAGLDVLHLQCHIGFDAISLARRGARVVGVDFSPAALEKARTLMRRCELRVQFIEADATALPVDLHNRFDLVYATIGVSAGSTTCARGCARPRRRCAAAASCCSSTSTRRTGCSAALDPPELRLPVRA